MFINQNGIKMINNKEYMTFESIYNNENVVIAYIKHNILKLCF